MNAVTINLSFKMILQSATNCTLRVAYKRSSTAGFLFTKNRGTQLFISRLADAPSRMNFKKTAARMPLLKNKI